MKPEFSGIEKRLERLKDCLSKLDPLADKSLKEIKEDPYLQDVIETQFFHLYESHVNDGQLG